MSYDSGHTWFAEEDFNNAVRDLKYSREKVKSQSLIIKELKKALKDFKLREEHMPTCPSQYQFGGGCKCMDKEYYSLRSCADRAIIALKKIEEVERQS